MRDYLINTDAAPAHVIRAASSCDAIIQTLDQYPHARRVSAKVQK